MARHQIATAILAGGASERLGGLDKGLKLLLGRPLIDWVVTSCAPRQDEEMLIVANRNAERYARFGTVIADSDPGEFRGPLAGVAAALAVTKSPWLHTLPVDCPAPPPGLLERLWQQVSVRDQTAVVAHDGVRRQPLFALYQSQLADSAAKALRSGLGVSAWQDLIGTHEVLISGRGVHWINLNTPSDFEDFAESWK